MQIIKNELIKLMSIRNLIFVTVTLIIGFSYFINPWDKYNHKCDTIEIILQKDIDRLDKKFTKLNAANIIDNSINENNNFYEYILKKSNYINEYANDRNEIKLLEIRNHIFNIVKYYDEQIKVLFKLIIITTIITISWVYIYDKKNNLDYIKYSSTKINYILVSQIISSLIYTFFIVTIYMFLFYFVNKSQNIGIFSECDLSHSASKSILSWYYDVFGGYIKLIILSIYILNFYLVFLLMNSIIKFNNQVVNILCAIIIIVFMSIYGLDLVINNITNIYYTVKFESLILYPYLIELTYLVTLLILLKLSYTIIKNKRILEV